MGAMRSRRPLAAAAMTAAALGMLAGPVLVAFVAGGTWACLIRFGKELPLRARLARRGLLVVSPLLIAPAAWYCLQRVARRERAA